MKKNDLLISLVVLLIISLNMVSVTSSSATIYVDPPNIVNTGTFTIDIKVSDVTNLYGYKFKLGYDKNILDATEVNLGSFLNEPTFPVVQEINDPAGYVWVSVTSLNPAAPKSGSGTLVTITFQVTGSGNCALDLYDTKLINNKVEKISHTVNDGYYGSISLGLMDSLVQFFRNFFGRFLLVMR